MSTSPGARPSSSRARGDQRRSVLDDATRALLVQPTATLAQVAAAAGVGRTTLHRMFPTRTDLLRAVALDALDVLEAAYREAERRAAPDGAEGTSGGDDPMVRLHRIVRAMIPLGPRLRYLVVAPELDTDDSYLRRARALDAPVHAAVAEAQDRGDIDPGLSAVWTTEVLYAIVFVAWEAIAAGTLAPADAPDLVIRTWLRGARPLA